METDKVPGSRSGQGDDSEEAVCHAPLGPDQLARLRAALKQIADRQGYTDMLTNAGAVLMTDTCPVFGHVYPEGAKVACTDSAKQAHYIPAWLGLETWFGSVEDCVEAAITGQWKGELR